MSIQTIDAAASTGAPRLRLRPPPPQQRQGPPPPPRQRQGPPPPSQQQQGQGEGHDVLDEEVTLTLPHNQGLLCSALASFVAAQGKQRQTCSICSCYYYL